MLLEDLMPVHDVVERHRIHVACPPDVTYRAIRTANLADAAVTRALLVMRALPAIVASGSWMHRRRPVSRLELADFERQGFRVVAERPGEELVIGLLGQFWTPSGDVCAEVGATAFAEGPPAGYALAAWNFTVGPVPGGGTELRTETRVWCASDVLWKFRAYWLLVRPGSGLIRRAMLRAIRREAEGR